MLVFLLCTVNKFTVWTNMDVWRNVPGVWVTDFLYFMLLIKLIYVKSLSSGFLYGITATLNGHGWRHNDVSFGKSNRACSSYGIVRGMADWSHNPSSRKFLQIGLSYSHVVLKFEGWGRCQGHHCASAVWISVGKRIWIVDLNQDRCWPNLCNLG